MQDNLYQIYLVTNIQNNKKYIGQVVQHRGYKVRFTEHLCGIKYSNSKRLSSAIKAYGKDNFKVELIEDNIPENAIDTREKYYIQKYNTFYRNGYGYNMTEGGQGVHGYSHTEAGKIKISESSKIFWSNLKQDPIRLKLRNKKISDKLRGRKKSDLARQHLSEAAIERFKHSDGTFKNKKHSEQTKILISEKNGFRVGMYDKNTQNLLLAFRSASEANKYLLDKNITKNKNAVTRILTICKHVKGQGKTAYGYIWKFLE